MEKRFCQHCHKNQAVRSYERVKNKPESMEYYCLECYSLLFTDEVKEESEPCCAHCGTKLSEVQKTMLVGCAYCYQSMAEGVGQLVDKMQGKKRVHVGQTPPLEGKCGRELPTDEKGLSELAEENRFRRQCFELQTIIDKLTSERNFEDAKVYADKLAVMKTTGRIKEGFVWRKRRDLLERR